MSYCTVCIVFVGSSCILFCTKSVNFDEKHGLLYQIDGEIEHSIEQ